MFRTPARMAYAFLVAVAILPAALLAADYKDLVQYLPSQPNAACFIDIDLAMKSPIAEAENWAMTRKDLKAKNPLMVPREATRMVSVAQVDMSDGIYPLWRVAVMQVKRPLDMSALASAKNGGIDTLKGKRAAWTPDSTYYVQFAPQVIGVVTPANRQFAQRWVENQAGSMALSSRLAAARRLAEAGSPFVLAFDLDGAFSPTAVLKYIRSTSTAAAKSDDSSIRALAALLASVQGVTLSIDLSDKVSARMVVDFASDATMLRSVAQRLFQVVLGEGGLYLQEMDDWKYTVQGKRITAEGQIHPESLRWIVGLVGSSMQGEEEDVAPAAAAATPTAAPAAQRQGDAPAQAAAPAKNAAADKRQQTIAASQKYFRTIQTILDQQYGKGTSLAKGSEWLARDAKRIRNLPVLNVDPDLMAWGLHVSQTLTSLSDQVKVSYTQVRSKGSGPSLASDYLDYDYGYYDGYNTGNIGGTAIHINRSEEAVNLWMADREKVGMDARANVAASTAKTSTDLRNSCTKMRITMTQRYGVEF